MHGHAAQKVTLDDIMSQHESSQRHEIGTRTKSGRRSNYGVYRLVDW